MGCGPQSGGHHPLQGRRQTSEVMALEVMGGGREQGRGGECRRPCLFPKRKPSPIFSAQAVLYSHSTVTVAGLPEDEKVKMLGNMPAKERRTVLVRD